MTNQEIFDKVYRHLLTQNEQSYSDDIDLCLYRGPRGMSCAVGCLIPDEFYISQIEGMTIGSLNKSLLVEILTECGIGTDSYDLLERLQTIHDQAAINRWGEALRDVAATFNLTVPKMDV